MALFKNAYESFNHGQPIRDLLYQYDSFLDSLEVIADFGCGSGLNLEWWATLETRDDPPEPRNYFCYGVDKNTERIDSRIKNYKNIKIIQSDIEKVDIVPVKIDLLWCYDTFQYVINPLETLKFWNTNMNLNGMLILAIPQAVHYSYNRLSNVSFSGGYFNYNIVNLMYMLAVNGFDCKDAYFFNEMNNMWLYAAVYKSNIAPMDPRTTSWYTLAETDLLNDTVKDCIHRYGYVKQEEIITTWLDKDFYISRQ